MIALVKLKKYMTNIFIFGIIINKLGYKQKSSSIILFLINKNTKISFCYTVLPLSLIVYLWIKYSKKLLFNIKKVV